MKSVGFIGKTNKTEIVQYIAKIINVYGKKVIVVDATASQRTRYTVPTIMGTETQSQYVVQYDNIDIAIGFGNMLELKKYLLSKGEDFNEYDYVLIDADFEEMIDEYDLKSANNLFFVSSYDKYDIKKGVELLKFLCASKRRADPEGSVDVDKILYYSELNSVDSKYVDRLAENLPINWQKLINYPFDQGDTSVNIRNQYAAKIDLRFLSKPYKEALINTTRIITGEENTAMLKKVVKSIERNTRFTH